MAITLAIFAAVQVAMPLWVRPHLIPPSQTIATTRATQATFNGFHDGTGLTATVVPGQPGAWIISSGAVNAAGQPVTAMPARCLPIVGASTGSLHGSPPPGGGLLSCLDSQGIRELVRYQPADRYWPFQFIETGIFLALALALAWFCFWRLGRRVA
jgi:hypothetical protein